MTRSGTATATTIIVTAGAEKLAPVATETTSADNAGPAKTHNAVLVGVAAVAGGAALLL